MVIVILGPTCVGKTKLSVELAKKINGEIINADSTQVYKNLDIATAKVTEEEKEGIPHHLFDIKDITDDYSIYDYQLDCRNAIDDILGRGKTPILVGGTGLYIKSALYNYEFVNDDNNTYDDLSNEELYNRVVRLDKENNIHKNNRKRLIRALNYMETTNKPYSKKEKTNELLYDTLFIGLTTDRRVLYDRINKRVDAMVKSGLLEEAKRIYDTNIRSKAVMTPIGYKELFPYFDGSSNLEICLDKIKQNSRHYAKRQYTFFNHQLPVKWFDVDFDNFNNTVCDVLDYINK